MPTDNPPPVNGQYTPVGALLRASGEERMAASILDKIVGDSLGAAKARTKSDEDLAAAEALDPTHQDGGWK